MTAATAPRPIRVLASPSASGIDGNPYIDLLYRGVREAGLQVREFDRRRLLDRPQIVHVHWPAALVRWESTPQAVADVAKVLTGLLVARCRGARIVWTGHDLEPHELSRPRLYRVYFALFTRLVDLWISLSPGGVRLLRLRYRTLRRRPVEVIPHGSYRPVYPARPARPEADRALALRPEAGCSLLLLGQIRRYKNVLPLLQAFVEQEEASGRLLIAGEVRGDGGLEAELRAAAGARRDVLLRFGRVPAAEVAVWHGAADVVVLPYDARTTLNSGALLLALSLDVPVVVPDTRITRELRDAVGERWVHLYRGDATDALAAARRASAEPRGDRPDLDAFAWPGVIDATVDVYRRLAGAAS